MCGYNGAKLQNKYEMTNSNLVFLMAINRHTRIIELRFWIRFCKSKILNEYFLDFSEKIKNFIWIYHFCLLNLPLDYWAFAQISPVYLSPFSQA